MTFHSIFMLKACDAFFYPVTSIDLAIRTQGNKMSSFESSVSFYKRALKETKCDEQAIEAWQVYTYMYTYVLKCY